MRNRTLRLPFGHTRAILSSSGAEFASALRQFNLPVDDFACSGARQGGSLVGLRLGELVVAAMQWEALQARCRAAPHVVFMLPLAGSGKIIQAGQAVAWPAKASIISMSHHMPVEVVSGASAILTLQPSAARLQAAVDAILQDGRAQAHGAAGAMVQRLLARGPLVDSGIGWSVDYVSALMNVAALIDHCNCDEDMLSRLGVEEVVTRLLAQLVIDQEQGAACANAAPSLPRSVKAVDLICEHIRSTIGSPLSVAQMERISGLSGRALSYAFRARFDCTPQEWQRNFLLDRARTILKDRDHTGSVKALAYELGFASPSSFAAFYRQRFGELPSETLASLRRGAPVSVPP